MEADLQNVQIIEEAFNALKEESKLDGNFLGTQMSDYLQEKDFDILYVSSHEDDFFVSDNLSIALLEALACDMIVAN